MAVYHHTLKISARGRLMKIPERMIGAPSSKIVNIQQSNLTRSISLSVERKSFYAYRSFPKLERISTL